MEDRFRAAEGDDRNGQGRARAGSVGEDRAAADRQSGRIETAETTDGKDLRGFAGERQGVDGLGAREGIGLEAGGLIGGRAGGREDVLGRRKAREGDDAVGRIIRREAVAVDGDARDQPVRLSRGGREGEAIGRRSESTGDVERAGSNDAERAEGQTLLAAAAHDEGAAARIHGEGGGSHVTRDVGGGEGLTAGGPRGGRAEDESGRVRDRGDGGTDRDISADNLHACREADGAGDRHVSRTIRRRAGGQGERGRGCVRDDFQHAAADVETAGGGAEAVHRVRRRVVEDELAVLEHDDATRRITQGTGADDVRGTAVNAVMVVGEGVGGRDVDDVIVDLVDVEAVGARGVGIIEVAGDIDRPLAEQVEEDVAIIGRGHVRADRAEGQGGAEVGTYAVVTIDVIVAADRIHQGQLAGDDIDAGGRTDRAEGIDAGDISPIACAGEVHRIGEARTAREFEGGGHAAKVDLAGGQLVRGGGADDAHVKIELAGPAGVGGAEHQGASGLLGERGSRTRGDVEGRGKRGGLAGRDFNLTGVGSVTEDDRTTEGKVVGETQDGRTAGSGRQDDLIGDGTELAIGRDREHTALDGHVTREVVGRIAEHEGAVTRLRETGAGDLTREREALGEVMNGGTRNGVDSASTDGDSLAGQQSVGIVIGQRETKTEVRDDPRGDGLVDGLIERQSAAGTTHGDVRDDAGVELDQTGERDILGHGGAITVRKQGQRGRITERGGVEVTGVSRGVKDQLAETLDLEGVDRSDIRDLTEHRDDKVRTINTDRGDAAGLADGEGAIEREGALVRTGVIEGRQAGEGQVVTDRTIVVIDEERGTGREADRARTEGAGGETEATLLRRAIVSEHDAT